MVLVGLGHERGHGHCRATGRRHSHDGRVDVGREQDVAGGVPGAASSARRFADVDGGRPFAECDALEFTLGEERDRRAISRPERKRRPISAGHKPRIRVHWPHPEPPALDGAPWHARDEGERSAIGRERGNVVMDHARRRIDGEPDGHRRCALVHRPRARGEHAKRDPRGKPRDDKGHRMPPPLARSCDNDEALLISAPASASSMSSRAS